MRRTMFILSEIWFELAKIINGIIFSFIFFWGDADYLPYIVKKIAHYLNHVGDITGSTAFYSLA